MKPTEEKAVSDQQESNRREEVNKGMENQIEEVYDREMDTNNITFKDWYEEEIKPKGVSEKLAKLYYDCELSREDFLAEMEKELKKN